MILVAAAAFTGVWIGYAHWFARAGSHALPWRDLTPQIGSLQFPHQVTRLFRRRVNLDHELAVDMPGRTPAVPQIDFDRRSALLVAMGPRSSTGYSLRVERVAEERARIVVAVHELTPSLRDPVRAQITYPYRLITFPVRHKPVYVQFEGRP